jgi:hypothetical protein
MAPTFDRRDDLGILEGTRNPFVLEYVFVGIDALRNVDREDKCHVDDFGACRIGRGNHANDADKKC